MCRANKEKDALISQEFLKSILDYTEDTGKFTWKIRQDKGKNWNNTYPGKAAGGTDPTDYSRIKINCISYLAHRLAWLYMTGSWPKEVLDHIDGDVFNNTFSNLRECSQSENTRNSVLYKNNTSGHVGVIRVKNKWVASIKVNKKRKSLGYFTNIEDAVAARKAAEDEYYGEFKYQRGEE